MRFLRNLPITHRLTIIVTLATGVALLLALLVVFGYEQAEARRDLVRDTSAVAAILAGNVSGPLSLTDPAAAGRILDSATGTPDIDGAVVYDKTGAVFAVYRNPASPEGQQFSPPPVAPGGYRFGDDLLQVSFGITHAGNRIGTLLVQTDLDEAHARVWESTSIAAVVLVVATALAHLLAVALLAPVSAPIAHLAEVVGTVGKTKDYSIRAVKQGDDELGRLIDGFNGMLGQLQAHDSALEQIRGGLEARVDERTRTLQLEIAERKDVEAALRDSEARLSGVFENASIGMALVSPEGRWLKVNLALCTLVGYSPEELAALSFQDITYPDDLPADNEYVRQMLAGEIQTYQMEKRYCHRLKHVIWVLLSVSLVRDGEGRPLHFISQIQDITERKRSEQALTESESRLRALIEHSSDMIVIVGLDGRVTYLSPSFKAISGYDPAEMMGRGFLELLHPDDRKAAVEQFRDLSGHPGQVQRAERRYRHKDGSWLVSDNIAVNLAHVPGVAGIVTTMRDVTARKRTDAELAQTHRQLLETSRLGGMAEVAASVLHNVGNALNGVTVSASLMVENLKSSRVGGMASVVSLLHDHRSDLASYITNDPRGRHIPVFLAEISRDWLSQQQALIAELEALRAHVDHIKGVVAMQQAYAGGTGVAELVQVKDLVEDSLLARGSPPLEHHIRVIRDFQDVPAIKVEKNKALQILATLLHNASIACDDREAGGGHITLRIALASGGVRVSVSDNGVGIAPENLARVFSQDFTTRKQGRSFGLHRGAIAAAEMGGRLTGRSDGLGQGATFLLDLPLQPPGAPA